jgi:hypothetical protein
VASRFFTTLPSNAGAYGTVSCRHHLPTPSPLAPSPRLPPPEHSSRFQSLIRRCSGLGGDFEHGESCRFKSKQPRKNSSGHSNNHFTANLHNHTSTSFVLDQDPKILGFYAKVPVHLPSRRQHYLHAALHREHHPHRLESEASPSYHYDSTVAVCDEGPQSSRPLPRCLSGATT